MEAKMIDFFYHSRDLDFMVTKQLSHICPNWELTWDEDKNSYQEEEYSFAEKLNDLISEISSTQPPKKYHDNEDCLAEFVKEKLNWNIHKVKNKWVCGDYASVLEQGGFWDPDETNLVQAATGRIYAAIKFGQSNFDEMEEGHKKILANVMANILYHRVD